MDYAPEEEGNFGTCLQLGRDGKNQFSDAIGIYILRFCCSLKCNFGVMGNKTAYSADEPVPFRLKYWRLNAGDSILLLSLVAVLC